MGRWPTHHGGKGAALGAFAMKMPTLACAKSRPTQMQKAEIQQAAM
jgi:hypothetical protein